MSVLFIDKPKGITSFDVCHKLRKVLGTRKIGHTGTLDPNATGVMIVLSDKDTKANQFLVSDKKEYIATCLFGIETDTLDIDGNIIKKEEYIVPSKEELVTCLDSFLGKSLQIPPMTSAIKVNGKKLYEYQREGKGIELKPRPIEIFEIELINITADGFCFRCSVSSGTYIRSLLKDILNRLGIIGTLKDLRRTKVDNICIDDCIPLDEVLNGKTLSHNMYDLLSYRYKTVEVKNPNDILNGKPVKLDCKDDKILLVHDKQCLAIYYKDKDIYRCQRGLF